MYAILPNKLTVEPFFFWKTRNLKIENVTLQINQQYMLKKEELKVLRIHFWYLFEQQNKKSRSVNVRRVNWTHYKTGVKDVYIRMDFNTHEAFCSIDLQMKDQGVRELVWEQFMETKNLLLNYVGSELQLLPNFTTQEGNSIHRMSWKITDVSITNENDYPQVIDFLSDKIKGVDSFWVAYSELFVALCK